MRTCTRCFIEKDADEFAFRSKEKSTRQAHCRECQKLISRGHYERNREKRIKMARFRTDIYRKENKERIWQYLLKHPCVDCGERNPLVLEFDHKGDKESGISDAVHAKGWGWERIKEEIDKCEVRCCNCHQIITHMERRTWKYGRLLRSGG